MRIDAGGDLQLQEVDREEFHSFLLSSVHTKCTDSSVVTKMNPSSSSLPGLFIMTMFLPIVLFDQTV